ncbi:MAG: arginine repressor [Christensenellales bacterium]
MKQGRHSKILELIDKNDIETQDELSVLLREQGYEVTQATISRDIKELKLIKVQSERGLSRYAASAKEHLGQFDIFKRVFRDTVLSVKKSAGLIVVHTMTGSANAAAEAIDGLDLPEIVGTIAGDNTIFVAVRELNSLDAVVLALNGMLGGKKRT